MAQSILLIDDSAILRRIATNVLGGQAVRQEVATATRATEGFARACATTPALILVDAQLVGAGAEWCQRLLDEPRTSAIPVVLLTGRGVPSPDLGSLPRNVVDVLAKPFTPEQLLSSVNAILIAMRHDGGFAAVRRRLLGERVHASAVLVDRPEVAETVAPGANACLAAEPGTSVADVRSVRETRPVRLDEVDRQRVKRPAAATASLRAALHAAAAEGASGMLSLFVRERPLMDVYFEVGKLVVVATREAGAYSVGAPQVLPTKVSPATLEAAVEEQRATGVPFFLTLGSRGLLSKAAAVDLVHRFGQRFFAQAWELRSPPPRCEFLRLDALPGFALRLEPRRESIDEWLLAALRGLSAEDVASTARHEGFFGTPVFTRQGQSLLNFLELTPPEREFARRVGGRLDLPGIAKGMGITPEAAYLVLCRFRALDIMEYQPAPAAFVVTPRTSVRRVLPLKR